MDDPLTKMFTQFTQIENQKKNAENILSRTFSKAGAQEVKKVKKAKDNSRTYETFHSCFLFTSALFMMAGDCICSTMQKNGVYCFVLL